MYQIKCDEYVLYDPRDAALIVNNPKCKLKTNTVGEASFSIYATHPFYNHLQKMRSVFEILQDGQPIFRGRMTNDSKDFDNVKVVDLEGVLAFFNDSVIRPFSFPDDFEGDADYIAAAASGNVVEFLLDWILSQHNSQVQEFQRFKLGNVTVADANNYISRSSTDYAKTWETLKSKLFESALGGFLCIRYEEDGNYIDYLSGFDLTNVQTVEYGKNLLDLQSDSDASAVCSAIIPLGAKRNEIDKASDDESRLTIDGLEDGNITEDIVKSGDFLYSRSAVESFGFICADTKSTTWEDVTLADNLIDKGVEYLSTTGPKLTSTIKITAIDLHASDAEIEAFRIYRYIRVNSRSHNHEDSYRLTELDIDILNPQNTKITLGDTKLSLTDVNSGTKKDFVTTVESIKKQTSEHATDLTEVHNAILEQSTAVVNTCEEIILSALESYVETSNYEEFKETVQAQLQIMADEIVMNFTTTTEQVTNVDGDLQAKFSELYKYIRFGENGITIGSDESGIVLNIDNDIITFSKNGVIFGKWDGNDFYTGNIIVEVNERAQFGNFAFIPRSDGSLSFLKVGE